MKSLRYKKIALTCAFTLAFNTFAGCSTSSNPAASSSNHISGSDASASYYSADSFIPSKENASAEFDAFITDIFNETVTDNSIDFHYNLEHPENFGLSMNEVTFGTASLDTIEQDIADTKEALETLYTFDEDSLSEEQQLIYEMLEENFDDYLQTADYVLYDTIFSPSLGIQAQLPVILSEYTFRTQQDVDDYILLLKDVDRYFNELLDIEKAKSEAGLFMADFTADAIISQCQSFIAEPENNLLIEIFREKLDTELPDLSDEQKSEYEIQNKEAILSDVIPAYENIIAELTALKGTGTNDAGLSHYENGQEYYSLLAKSATGSDKTVPEMIELTDQSLEADLNMVSLLYSKDSDIVAKMEEAQPPTSDPKEILEQLQEAILDDFPAPVSDAFKIKYVHKSLEEDLSPAFYMIPAIDAKDSNTIYINNYYTNADDAMSLYSTLAHEGYPGHLYEATWFNSTQPHPIRKLLNYSGYTEGWATYVEMQSFKWAAGDENLATAFWANQDFSLGICARVDMGVNYEGWSREETKAFLDDYNMGNDDTVTWIYEAVIAEPANYLSYYIGYKEFRELRREAEETLGNAFDAVTFHKFILTTGPAPFELIEERMENWIDS